MTVGYLKEQLENYPDDARIILDCGPISQVFEDKSVLKDAEIIDMYSVKDHDEVIFMQTRDDFDYMNELVTKKAHLMSAGFDNWKAILLNQGFTEDEIKEAEDGC